MRRISGCRASFLQRSGVLLRSVHLMRHILAACPATPEVCVMAYSVPQPTLLCWCFSFLLCSPCSK